MRRAPLYTFLEWIRFRVWFARLYRVDITGRERVPRTGAVVLCANHESMIDPWLLALVSPRPIRYMAKAELFRRPLLRHVMEAFGTFPVDRGAGDQTAVDRGAQLLAEGEALGIFPQGTCLPYRRRPWHRGAAKLALAAGATVVPVCIVGSERALRPGKFKVGLPQVRVVVGDPIAVARTRPTIAAAKALTQQIERAVDELRAPYGPPAHAWYPDDRSM
jgi:1-acyl-sn-glycerol-3-phosphate acyltransferase